jgi:hypothetical protein
VDTGGVVAGVNVGVATITGVTGGVTFTTQLTVNPANPFPPGKNVFWTWTGTISFPGGGSMCPATLTISVNGVLQYNCGNGVGQYVYSVLDYLPYGIHVRLRNTSFNELTLDLQGTGDVLAGTWVLSPNAYPVGFAVTFNRGP